MANPPLSDEAIREAVAALQTHGTVSGAAVALGVPRQTIQGRLFRAKQRGYIEEAPRLTVKAPEKAFEVAVLPDEIPSAEEILERRAKQFARKSAAERARQLIPVKITVRGPIGIMHVGDPHLDDDGTDISLFRSHVELVNRTEGLLAANVGDLHNNWIGRLAKLYGQQSVSAAEAWRLVEWMFGACSWVYVVGGNHDVWSGAGDPSQWLARFHGTLYEWHGARVGLQFPNGREIRVNARHDFPGRSIYNAAHGPARAARFGWRDHILTCGHTHTSGYQVLKDPMSGLISHAIRAGSYKAFDAYAKERGYFDETAFVAPVTVIDPSKADDDPGCVTFLPEPFMAAEFLTWLRGRKSTAGV